MPSSQPLGVPSTANAIPPNQPRVAPPNANVTAPQITNISPPISQCTTCHLFHPPSLNCPSLSSEIKIRLALDEVKNLSGGDPASTQRNRVILQGILKSRKNGGLGEIGSPFAQTQQQAQQQPAQQPQAPQEEQKQPQQQARLSAPDEESSSSESSSESESESESESSESGSVEEG